MALHLSGWDMALVAAVSVHATVLAYVHAPRWKALVLSFPVPFSMAVLSLGRRPDATNVVGLILLLLFTHGVRILYRRARVPIVGAIVLSTAAYCAAGTRLATLLPGTDRAFWTATGATFLLAALLYWKQPHQREPGHRSPLPLWAKLPITAVVVLGLVLIKRGLGGFMTAFPMVGVVAAYEARHSLWTMSRQMPVILMTMLPMIAVIRVLEPLIGLGAALGAGWLVFLAFLGPVTARRWAREERGGG